MYPFSLKFNLQNLSQKFFPLTTHNELKKQPQKYRILFDCDSCLCRLSGGYYHDYQSGGQWATRNELFHSMLRSCEYADLEMVFFFNGSVPVDEQSYQWLVEQRARTHQIWKIFNDFCPVKKAGSSPFLHNPYITEFIQSICHTDSSSSNKRLFSFQSHDDHCKEILDFCRQFKCDVLLTDNLDIITMFYVNQNLSIENPERISGTKLCSAKSFKVTHRFNAQISFSEYNFEKFMQFFKFVSIDQLVWFSVLLGTRHVQAKWLIDFYEKLMKKTFKSSKLIDNCLAELLNSVSNYVSTEIDSSDQFDKISTFIFGYDYYKDAKYKKKQLKLSLSYFYETIPTENIYCMFNETDDQSSFSKPLRPVPIRGQVLNLDISLKDWVEKTFIRPSPRSEPKISYETSLINRMKILNANTIISPFIWQVLSKQKYFFASSTIEPINDHNELKSDRIFLSIRKYLYSLIISGLDLNKLLQASNSNNKISYRDHLTVEEHVYNPTTYKIDITQIDVFPYTKAFTIEDLWMHEANERMSYFLHSISNQDMMGTFEFDPYVRKQKFTDVSLFIPCCVLRYLARKHRLLCSNDINAFLLTFVFIKLQSNSNFHHKFENCCVRNARATHLASLFLRAIEHFSIANDVCGNPVEPTFFRIDTFFSGIFFQLCYSNCTANNNNFFEKIICNDLQALKISMEVASLKKFVFHKIADKISTSLENVDEYNLAQYESKMVVDRKPLHEEHIIRPVEQVDLEASVSSIERIFAKENEQKRFLASKISPANNHFREKGCGRGILSNRNKQQPFKNDLQKSLKNSNASMCDLSDLEIGAMKKHREPMRAKSMSTETSAKQNAESTRNRQLDYPLNSIILFNFKETIVEDEIDIVEECLNSTRYRCDFSQFVK